MPSFSGSPVRIQSGDACARAAWQFAAADAPVAPRVPQLLWGALAERTFRDAFAAQNRAEDMELHCARSYSPAIQAAEIADPALVTLVVEAGGRLIAYAQLHLGGEPPGGVAPGRAVELRRIYLERPFHGGGLAERLMARVAALAADRGAETLWLGVWEHNPRAIRFCRRLGFIEVGEHRFTLGADPQRDLLMARPLTA